MVHSYAEDDSTLRAARRVRLCVDAPGWGGKEWGWDSMSRTRPLWPSPSLGSRKQIKHHNISVNHKALIRNQYQCWFWQKSEQRRGKKSSILPINYWHVKNRGSQKYHWNNFNAMMQQLWFINQHLAHYVSGTIMPIFRSERPYITAYGFQHLMCWLEFEWHPPHSAHGLPPGLPRHQPAHQVLKTICSNIWSSVPEDAHNDARNMLS